MAKYSKRHNRDDPLTSFEGTHKSLGDVLRAARKAGVVVRRSGNGHFKLETAHGSIIASSTPRVPDVAAKRLRRDLKAKGIDLRTRQEPQ